MTLRELTDYYALLLIYEYRGLPRANAQMQLYAKQAVADFLAGQVQTCFVLNSAIGAQLDTLGKYIGINRNVGLPAEVSSFGFWTYGSSFAPSDYQGIWDPVYNLPTLSGSGSTGDWYIINQPGSSTSPITATFKAGDIIWWDGAAWVKSTVDNGNGLTTYSNAAINNNSLFLQYVSPELQNTALPDDQYREVLKLRIIQNSSSHSLASLMESLYAVYPTQISLSDNKDMSLSYTVLNSFPLPLPLLQRFLPRPMAVGITVTLISPVVSGGYLLTESGDRLTTENGSPLLVS